jgi:hypothetical protein
MSLSSKMLPAQSDIIFFNNYSIAAKLVLSSDHFGIEKVLAVGNF